MAKSNRRRKLDRAKRQVRDAQNQVATSRRLAAEETFQDVIARYDRLADPGTPAAELAGLLNEVFGHGPVSVFVVNRMLANGSSLGRLVEAAEAILGPDDSQGTGPSLTALTFAAEVARARGEAESARELLDRALAAAGDDAECQVDLVQHLRAVGRLADGISLLEARLRDTPDDGRAAEHYGVAIGEAHERVNHQEASDPCSCGRGVSWEECCGPRERAALSRFTDRSGLNAISDAITAFLVTSQYGRTLDDQVTDHIAAFDDLDWKPEERASFRALLAEHALLSAKPPADDLGDEGDQEEDQAVGPLTAFAADPSVPRELAAKADTWRRYIHYGLWRIDGRSVAPGFWCVDICSGVVRYAEFPAGLTAGWPRWSVWLGGIVPVDGVWRATGTGLRLSPAEADAAAEYVQDASVSLVHALAGKKRRSRSPAETFRFGHADPRGVLVDLEEPASPELASVMEMVVGHLLPRIVGEVYLHRWTPPAMRNSDGDEVCLITAEIAVNDSEHVSDRLVARPGFERDADDPARILWYGIRIPEAERQGMLAEGGAQLRTCGLASGDLEDAGGLRRWERGALRVGVGQIVAEVNSDKRLARLLEVLAKVGAAPTVTDEKRIGPAQDFVRAGYESARRRGAAPSGQGPSGQGPSGQGWEKQWLDEPLPAVGGRTPREAAQGKERPLLEALLRQFEYEADLLAAQGQEGIDTDRLRQELGLADELAD